MRYRCRSDESKCVDPFFWLAGVEDKRTGTVERGANLFPEHLDDPQKTLSLDGVWVAEILMGL